MSTTTTTAAAPFTLDCSEYADGYVEPPRTWRRWAVAATTVLALCGAFATAAVWGVSALALPAGGDVPSQAPESVIVGGQLPAVAATQGGRIIDVDCVVAGPIEVAEDGTGAFVVTGGGPRVTCPHEAFHNGLTLRWPAAAAPDTVPAGR